MAVGVCHYHRLLLVEITSPLVSAEAARYGICARKFSRVSAEYVQYSAVASLVPWKVSMQKGIKGG
jgi:hypothetical protein